MTGALRVGLRHDGRAESLRRPCDRRAPCFATLLRLPCHRAFYEALPIWDGGVWGDTQVRVVLLVSVIAGSGARLTIFKSTAEIATCNL